MNAGKVYLKMPTAHEANRDMVFMVLPLLVMACYLYGARPAVLCAAAVVTATVCDYLVAWLRGFQRDQTENSSVPAALVMTMLQKKGKNTSTAIMDRVVAVRCSRALATYSNSPSC